MTVQDILEKMREPTETDITLVTKAYTFAENAHQTQKRYSGEPYFVHVAETGKLLAENNMSATTIAAGLLHDTIEDAGVTVEIMQKEFGPEILFLVQGVTKLGKLRYHGVDRHNESLRKFFVATSQDLRILIIKLADRLHNMRTLEHVPEHKQVRIASETLYIYAPLAYRLGMRKMSRELEDIAFKFVLPKEAVLIEKITRERTKKDLNGIEKFHHSVLKALAAENIKARTDFRIKGLYSLYKKLQRKEQNVEKIYDIAAIRIIVPTVSDCYKALGVIHAIWRPLPGRIKDYIAFPKPNGYQSLHTTIFRGDKTIIEVQIKTEEMYQDSEYGVASHISYKENPKSKTPNSNLAWIQHLLPSKEPNYGLVTNGNTKAGAPFTYEDIPEWLKDLAKYKPGKGGPTFEENITSDFSKERIFVFTPKGDVVDLPTDSTPIDFAYSIHSAIGDHMAGAKVNGKIASMDSALKNGDIVEIITRESSKPTAKWLGFARTSMAKKHIKNASKTPSEKKPVQIKKEAPKLREPREKKMRTSHKNPTSK
ncbi:MAG: HD domain-containing protein [Candidatus Paceibacterota bacterium]|jgi:GTP pyrophosphokinase